MYRVCPEQVTLCCTLRVNRIGITETRYRAWQNKKEQKSSLKVFKILYFNLTGEYKTSYMHPVLNEIQGLNLTLYQEFEDGPMLEERCVKNRQFMSFLMFLKFYVWGEGNETWSYFSTMSSSLTHLKQYNLKIKSKKISNDEITSPKNTCTS